MSHSTNNSLYMTTVKFFLMNVFFQRHAFIIHSFETKLYEYPFINMENIKRVSYRVFSRFKKLSLLERINAEYYIEKVVKTRPEH